MKASELVARVSVQIAQHGDLEIMIDADSMLLEPEEVQFLDQAYLTKPLLVIMPTHDDEKEDGD
jgi:hypothetical protein